MPLAVVLANFRRIPVVILVGFFTFVFYALATAGQSTAWNAHTQLARAILAGAFSLSEPYGTHELIRDTAGHVYIAYGPTAAFLLLPLVAIFGPAANQTLFSALFGALAVALWWATLGRLGVARQSQRWLTFLFAAGTPFAYYAAENGNNWAITHCVASLCLMAALYALVTEHAAWGGFFLGMAAISRNPVLLLAPVLLIFMLGRDAEGWRTIRYDWRKIGRFGLGIGIALAIAAYYNWERFGSVLENGYAQLLLTDPISAQGSKPTFALAYLAHNVPFYLFSPPVWLGKFPWFGPSGVGMSMLLATPVLWLLPWANYRKPSNLAALLGISVVQIFYWLFIGDGRGQFGMRYTTDYLPMVLLLVAAITRERFGVPAMVLTIMGVLVEIWGFITWHAMGW
ncbi:MAG: hypothetical protein HY692_05525 [Cyanobacteria bacterium NC_groundwater_1444_Ag_S-0.65um_54_12]|nr:hypothetical protein [Cyanobacteria bacterium NC_groundwater_1444_Ag_S-0.65um_54_12]